MAMTVALYRFNERPALLEREDFSRLAHRSGQDFRTCFERTHQVGAQFLKGLPINRVSFQCGDETLARLAVSATRGTSSSKAESNKDPI